MTDFALIYAALMLLVAPAAVILYRVCSAVRRLERRVSAIETKDE